MAIRLDQNNQPFIQGDNIDITFRDLVWLRAPKPPAAPQKPESRDLPRRGSRRRSPRQAIAHTQAAK